MSSGMAVPCTPCSSTLRNPSWVQHQHVLRSSAYHTWQRRHHSSRLSCQGPRQSKAAASNSEVPTSAQSERTSRGGAKKQRTGQRVPGQGVPEKSGHPTAGTARNESPANGHHQRHRPHVSALVVVEGPNDRRAVCQAVDAEVRHQPLAPNMPIMVGILPVCSSAASP
jgi:hypothetical protein